VRAALVLRAFSELGPRNTDAWQAIAGAMYDLDSIPDPKFLVLFADGSDVTVSFVQTPVVVPTKPCWVYPLEQLI
jgi:hypothetical protein